MKRLLESLTIPLNYRDKSCAIMVQGYFGFKEDNVTTNFLVKGQLTAHNWQK